MWLGLQQVESSPLYKLVFRTLVVPIVHPKFQRLRVITLYSVQHDEMLRDAEWLPPPRLTDNNGLLADVLIHNPNEWTFEFSIKLREPGFVHLSYSTTDLSKWRWQLKCDSGHVRPFLIIALSHSVLFPLHCLCMHVEESTLCLKSLCSYPD